MQAILDGATETIHINGPIHTIQEKFSARRKEAHIQTKFLSPLLTPSGTVGGYLSCTTLVKLIERDAVAPSPREFSLDFNPLHS